MAKIYLNAEHGGTDSGATANGIREDEANLKVAKYAREYLSGYDCTTVMSRETDNALSINERVAQVRAQKPNLVITIAHNAGGGDGCEVFYWHTDSKAKAFAQELIKQFQAIGQNSRGVKPSQPGSYNFGMCREPAAMGIPAVLGEFAFLDNKADVVLVDSDADLKREGEAYGKAIVNYLGLKKKTAQPEKPSEPSVGGAIKVGDIVQFTGGKVYASSTAATAAGTRGASKCKVTATAPGAKHPFHCISEDGKGVYGWVDAAAIEQNGEAAPVQPVNRYRAGRKIAISNASLYASSTAKNAARKLSGTYYLYDGKAFSGRYRITPRADWVGKTPIAGYVTGYIGQADIPPH